MVTMGKLVFVNGCFDLLHPGHVYLLEQASALGDCLMVGLNSDASVRTLKGPNRPKRDEGRRAVALAALDCVDYVLIFKSARCDELIRLLRPDIYVKGGDWSLEGLDPGERAALEECGTEIVLLPRMEGYSTTAQIKVV